MKKVPIAVLALLAVLCGCDKPHVDPASWQTIENPDRIEVYYLGDKDGSEDDRLIVTLKTEDIRFTQLKAMVIASKGKLDNSPKAPHSDDGFRFHFLRGQSDHAVVTLRLDSIDVDGVYYEFNDRMEIYKFFQPEIDAYHAERRARNEGNP